MDTVWITSIFLYFGGLVTFWQLVILFDALDDRTPTWKEVAIMLVWPAALVWYHANDFRRMGGSDELTPKK